MKVLVTGGAGFIGTNLAERLISRGDAVVVIDDFSSGLKSNIESLPVKLYEGSITDIEVLRRAASECDAIVHLAARGSVPRSIRNPRATHEVNATGTLNVLEVAREGDVHVVFSSSSSVYGANPALPKREDMWISPISPYAASKAGAESYIAAYASAYGLRATCFRFFNVFGPWQRSDHVYAAVIPRWIAAALQGRPVQINGDGATSRDFTFVAEVIDVIERTLIEPVIHAEPVNLAFGRSVSLDSLASELHELLGPFDIEYVNPRQGDIPHSQNDPALLNELFPGVVRRPFSESLAQTAEWLRGNLT